MDINYATKIGVVDLTLSPLLAYTLALNFKSERPGFYSQWGRDFLCLHIQAVTHILF